MPCEAAVVERRRPLGGIVAGPLGGLSLPRRWIRSASHRPKFETVTILTVVRGAEPQRGIPANAARHRDRTFRSLRADHGRLPGPVSARSVCLARDQDRPEDVSFADQPSRPANRSADRRFERPWVSSMPLTA